MEAISRQDNGKDGRSSKPAPIRPGGHDGRCRGGTGFTAGYASALTPLRQPGMLEGKEFNLTIGRQPINLTGRQSWANTINGGVPGPVLRWREGDVIDIHVKNEMPELTGLHWHGIILPAQRSA